MKKLFLFGLIAYASINLFAQDLELTISQDKTEYLEVEPIWIKVSLRNKCKQVKKVDVISYQTVVTKKLKFDLKDLNGNRLSYRGPIGDGTKKVILQPEEITYGHFDLLDFYGDPYDINIKSVRHFLNSHDYSLSVTLKTSDENLHSNTIKFSVKEPVGFELEAYNIFKEGFLNWLIKKQNLQAIGLFNKLINDYPNSVYIGTTYINLFRCYKWNLRDYEKAIEVGEELINKYPKSHFSERMVKYISYEYEHLSKSEKINKKMMEFVNKYGDINPEISKNALEMIDRLETEK